MPNTANARPRNLTLAAIYLAFVLLVIVLAAKGIGSIKGSDQRAMESLAQFVLDRGKAAPMPTEPLQYFGLPTADPTFYELRAGSESGRTKGVFVRERPDAEAVDIFFAHIDSSDLRGYFYLTSTHARLIKAAYFDDEPEPIDNADERFDHEKEFWFLWQGEKIKWEARRR